MAGKVFISYSQKQRQAAGDLAAFLTSEGYSVWWDPDLVPGARFREVIERELIAADAVIVIWTNDSVGSDWVLSEAEHARRNRKLIPLRTRDLKAAIPWPFDDIHTGFVDDRSAILAAIKQRVAPYRPISQVIASSIPYLRQYARWITGEQRSGDAYVGIALEEIVKDPTSIPIREDKLARLALYRIFTKQLNSANRLDLSSPISLSHQAFLLVTMANFLEEDAAYVLDVDVSRFRSLVAEAGREMVGNFIANILIIEDEPLIFLDMENIVEGLGHRVIGIARTRAEAINLAKKERPDLILADIQLLDGSSGLHVVKEINLQVPVIFVTSYPERFLTGERREPAFLCSKPYQESTISSAISQALFLHAHKNSAKRIKPTTKRRGLKRE